MEKRERYRQNDVAQIKVLHASDLLNNVPAELQEKYEITDYSMGRSKTGITVTKGILNVEEAICDKICILDTITFGALAQLYAMPLDYFRLDMIAKGFIAVIWRSSRNKKRNGFLWALKENAIHITDVEVTYEQCFTEGNLGRMNVAYFPAKFENNSIFSLDFYSDCYINKTLEILAKRLSNQSLNVFLPESQVFSQIEFRSVEEFCRNGCTIKLVRQISDREQILKTADLIIADACISNIDLLFSGKKIAFLNHGGKTQFEKNIFINNCLIKEALGDFEIFTSAQGLVDWIKSDNRGEPSRTIKMLLRKDEEQRNAFAHIWRSIDLYMESYSKIKVVNEG